MAALFALAWLILWGYLAFSKSGLEDKIRAVLRQRTTATMSVREIRVSFFHTFPFISLELSGLVLRDSLWSMHGHDLLKAEKVYAEINPFKIFLGKTLFRNISAEGGMLYLYTDSSGYSNFRIFRTQKRPDEKADEDYPDLSGRDMEFIVDKQARHKIFDFKISQFSSTVRKINHILFFGTYMNLFVRDLVFNPNNGSFLREKRVSGHYRAQFGLDTKILSFDDIDLDIDGHPFVLSGKFFTGLNPAPYELAFRTKKMDYKKAVSLFSPNIARKLSQYNIDQPFSMDATLDGSNPLLSNPVIHLKLHCDNSTVTTPYEVFANCAFEGSFFNRMDSLRPPADENSMLSFQSFSGNIENIPLQADSIVFRNLIAPQLSCNLRSTFPLESLKNIFDSKVIDFRNGTANLDIRYRGPVEHGDSIDADINGNVAFDGATVKYIPRNFQLTNCNGRLLFQNKDLLIEQLTARAGTTELRMSGGIKRLLALIDKSPEKLFLDWTISSPRINLHDFSEFARKSAGQTTASKKKTLFSRQVSRIDSLLRGCDVHIKLRANALVYKKFQSTGIRASVLMKNGSILLDSVALNGSGGSILLAGLVKNNGQDNELTIHAAIRDVDADALLASFGDFGQDALQSKNIRGKLTADVNFQGILGQNEQIAPGSLSGNIEFSLRNGELLDYSPVENVGRKVFKDRNFADIRFNELRDRFDIRGSAIRMNRMEIESTAIKLFVEGVYDTKKGTDLSIQVPLSNLKERTDDTVPVNRGTDSKTGISVRLRAKTGSDGKIRLSWDPFKKALKEIRKNAQPAT